MHTFTHNRKLSSWDRTKLEIENKYCKIVPIKEKNPYKHYICNQLFVCMHIWRGLVGAELEIALSTGGEQ